MTLQRYIEVHIYGPFDTEKEHDNDDNMTILLSDVNQTYILKTSQFTDCKMTSMRDLQDACKGSLGPGDAAQARGSRKVRNLKVKVIVVF